ncbi:DUF4184 family protein [Nocardioides sp. zg-ZUI104]|uniref:DUF4184 family protein n=1 Tax=Nocardioides faecalis TaxID=2803858 RepID=UPI001BCAC735|nr:DUF4184 family protein [Nocardioides faecalis]MBS4754613.1 DUF4184 family protein [Nocardioides faecalis]
MPVTIAHPAAVLPLRRLGLPMVALVIGSVAPDLPVFLGAWGVYGVTHSALGIVSVDLVVALAVLLLWFTAVRDALVDMAPQRLRIRLRPRVRLSGREWLLAVPAACLGALTHVGWDSFTHADRWGTSRIAWLREEHAGLLGAQWAQYGSGVVGSAVLGWYLVHLVRSRKPLAEPRAPRVLPAATLPVVLAAAAATGLLAVVRHAPDPHAMAYFAVVDGVIALVVATLAACVAWHVVRARRVSVSSSPG